MTYRDEQLALDERKAALQRDLDSAKEKLDAQKHLAAQTARIERELTEIEARLRGEKRRLPMLDNISIASPCHAEWKDMVGDDRVRFCGSCEKNVFNLSAMTRDEAEALIIASGAKICVRMFRRADGTVMTQDCSVGAKKKHRKRLAAVLAGAAALGAAATVALKFTTKASTPPARPERIEAIQGGLQPVQPEKPELTNPVPPEAIQGQMMQGEPMIDMGVVARPNSRTRQSITSRRPR